MAPIQQPPPSLLVQAMLDVRGSISRQYLCLVRLAIAFRYLDLFGTPLDRGFPIFRGDLIGINQFLRNARVQGNDQENDQEN